MRLRITLLFLFMVSPALAGSINLASPTGTVTCTTNGSDCNSNVVLSNGANQAAVKPASTAALASDPALVVGISPNTSAAVTGVFWQATQPMSGTFWQT